MLRKILVAPTLIQQRAIAVALILALGVLSWWQNTGSYKPYTIQKFSATPLGKEVAELNFTVPESSWSDLQFDAQGKLIINSQTEPALSDAITLVQHHDSTQAIGRLELLLQKQYGTESSEKILSLLYPLKKYKDIEQQWLQENGNQMPPPYKELFQLQDQVLGEELAKKLFAEQRRIANIMLASYQIRNDNNLSQEEKERAVTELQAKFQNGVKQEKPNEPGF